MLFHSAAFAILLATVLVLDRVVHRLAPGARGWRARCGIYLLASLVFYGWWDPGRPPPQGLLDAAGALEPAARALWRVRFLGLLSVTVLFDFWVGLRLGRTADPRRRKLLLAASVTLQLGILATFKYWNFLRDAVTAPLGGASWIPSSDLVLPVGISFYTFKSLSYTVDVYRGVIAPEPRLARFAMFVTFFPELVAGPIVRARDFLWQVQTPKKPKTPRLVTGLERFAIGLFKKLVIADNLTPLTDPVFANPNGFSAANNAAALLLWSVVIYADFSGYSDMAIGCARMLGFKFLENFHFPYLSRSVTEFWRRWHISLSTWLRDYLYIPLGGNRHGAARTAAALMATMLLGGLWHGASWNFVVWGAWWGAWLLAAHLARRTPLARYPAAAAWAGTVVVAALGWLPFRCRDLAATRAMASRIFSSELLGSWGRLEVLHPVEFEMGRSVFLAAALALACFAAGHAWGLFTGRWRLERRDRSAPGDRFALAWQGSRRPLVRGAFLALLFMASFLLRASADGSFIYFQF